MDLFTHLQEAASFIKEKINIQPEIGIILGSGLGSLAEEITEAITIPFAEVPHMVTSTAKGHKGQFVIGMLSGKKIIALQGRLHYYEGYKMFQVVFPVRIMAQLGVKNLIVSNACGGINPILSAGSLMLIQDHINFMGTNPLIGANIEQLGPRFPDMSKAYDPEFGALAKKVAKEEEIQLHKGVYTAVTGPYYFSDAEHRMVQKFGTDAIGMSTVPEVIVARHAGLRVLGISCVTDMVDPNRSKPLTHEEVLKVSAMIRPQFKALVKRIIREMKN